MRCSCTLYYHGLSIHDLFSYSLMISPVVCDRRVGLCGAVEFYEVALQNRLRLHREIYKWEIYKNIETQRQPITELAASSNMLQWTVNLRQTLCCQHCLWLKKTQQEKWKLCLILQRRQNTLINSGGNMQPQNTRRPAPPCFPLSLLVWQVLERGCGLFSNHQGWQYLVSLDRCSADILRA